MSQYIFFAAMDGASGFLAASFVWSLAIWRNTWFLCGHHQGPENSQLHTLKSNLAKIVGRFFESLQVRNPLRTVCVAIVMVTLVFMFHSQYPFTFLLFQLVKVGIVIGIGGMLLSTMERACFRFHEIDRDQVRLRLLYVALLAGLFPLLRYGLLSFLEASDTFRLEAYSSFVDGLGVIFFQPVEKFSYMPFLKLVTVLGAYAALLGSAYWGSVFIANGLNSEPKHEFRLSMFYGLGWSAGSLIVMIGMMVWGRLIADPEWAFTILDQLGAITLMAGICTHILLRVYGMRASDQRLIESGNVFPWSYLSFTLVMGWGDEVGYYLFKRPDVLSDLFFRTTVMVISGAIWGWLMYYIAPLVNDSAKKS